MLVGVERLEGEGEEMGELMGEVGGGLVTHLHGRLPGVLDANLAAEAASFECCVPHCLSLTVLSNFKNDDR